MQWKNYPKKSGQPHGYVVGLPNNYDPSKKWPLKIIHHGQGEIGDGTDSDSGLNRILNFIKQQINWTLTGERFIIIWPQLMEAQWNSNGIYTTNALTFARANFSLDEGKKFLSGISLGGQAIWGYLTNCTNEFNKVVSCCCVGINGDFCRIKIPVWGFHGKDDTVVLPSNTTNIINAINACSPPVAAMYHPYEPGSNHYIWSKVFGEIPQPENVSIWDWFLGGSITPPPTPTTLKADASATLTSILGTSALLDGSRSTGYKDTGTWKDLKWQWIGGPNFPGNSNSYGEKITVTNLINGTYTYDLIAGDGSGKTSSSRIVLSVQISGITIVGESTVDGRPVNLFSDKKWEFK